MQVVILTNESLKEELLSDISVAPKDITWIKNISQLKENDTAEVFIDLLFEKEHTSILQFLPLKLVIVNSVEETLAEINSSFIRINGWPTFLKSPIIEASSLNDQNKKKTEKIFSLLSKKIEWLPDEIGFITPRIVSTIINEAFISLKEGISTKEEIDIAMKLGTNYPFGPFEWCQKIGEKKIASLLQQLSKENNRYNPAALLLK